SEFKQRRARPSVPWDDKKPWEEEELSGRVRTRGRIRSIWIKADDNNIDAALTIAHEASHVLGKNEFGARSYEAEVLIEIPHYLGVAAERERSWVIKRGNRFIVDEAAIRRFLSRNRVYLDEEEAAKPDRVRLVRYREDRNGERVTDFGGP